MGGAHSISGETEMKRLYEMEKYKLTLEQRERLEEKYREVKTRSRGFTALSLNACKKEWDEVVCGGKRNGDLTVERVISDKWDDLNREGCSGTEAKPHFDLTPSEKGAWRQGAAPVTMFTRFLVAVQTESIDDALDLSEKILDCEPDNQLIKDYQPALLAKKRLMEEAEHETEIYDEESDEEESDEESDEEESEDDESIFTDVAAKDEVGDGGGEEESGEDNESGENEDEQQDKIQTTLHKLPGGWLIENEFS